MSKQLEAALKAIAEANRILKDYFSRGDTGGIESKGGVDRVTGAEKEVEACIRNILMEAFPNYRFKGEELGEAGKNSSYIWHVDPLCGTFEFIDGSPFFAVSIGLEHDKKPILGVVGLPALDEVYYGEVMERAAYRIKGSGSPKKIHVSDAERLTETVIVSDGGEREPGKIDMQYALMAHLKKTPLRNVILRGSTPFALVEAASGRKAGFVQLYESSVHFLGGVAVALSAGATVTNRGNKFDIYDTEALIVSNGKIHGALRERVNSFFASRNQ